MRITDCMRQLRYDDLSYMRLQMQKYIRSYLLKSINLR